MYTGSCIHSLDAKAPFFSRLTRVHTHPVEEILVDCCNSQIECLVVVVIAVGSLRETAAVVAVASVNWAVKIA